MFKGVVVNHKKFGEGVVVSVEDKTINVDFGGVVGSKTFSIPFVFEKGFLDTEDVALGIHINNLIAEAMIAQMEKEEAERKALEKAAEEKASYEKKLKECLERSNGVYCTSDEVERVFVKPVQTISFIDNYERFYAIGFIARFLNRISVLMTEDRVENLFDVLGSCDYTLLKNNEKSECRFIMEFDSDVNLPISLKPFEDYAGAKKIAICRSGFAFELVHDFGFQLGDSQNINEIRRIADALGFISAFDDGYYCR